MSIGRKSVATPARRLAQWHRVTFYPSRCRVHPNAARQKVFQFCLEAQRAIEMLRLRLSHKIMSIGAVGAIGLVLVGGIYLAGIASQERQRAVADNAREVQQQVARVEVELLEVRRAEKDFLLRKDEAYVKRHSEFARKVGADLAALQHWTAGAGDLEQKRLAIVQKFGAYATHFTALFKARIKLGLDEN